MRKSINKCFGQQAFVNIFFCLSWEGKIQCQDGAVTNSAECVNPVLDGTISIFVSAFLSKAIFQM